MSFITTKDGVEIFYKDWGKGQPIVFSHGWPLSSDDWGTARSRPTRASRTACPPRTPRRSMPTSWRS